MIEEGIAREVVNKIQRLRKKVCRRRLFGLVCRRRLFGLVCRRRLLGLVCRRRLLGLVCCGLLGVVCLFSYLQCIVSVICMDE